MTDTVLIGAHCSLGQYWEKQRFFDFLIDESNQGLLRGRDFGQAVLICPSLWTKTRERDAGTVRQQVRELIERLGETKIERLTYITSIDIQAADANEETPFLRDSGDEVIAGQLELYDFLNLKFGRVLNVFLPEVTGCDAPGNTAARIKTHEEGNGELPVALLERHQLYPLHRLVDDVEKARACGLGSVNLVPEPVTSFELTEACFAPLAGRLPVAKEGDPYGSNRTSLYSFHYHDPNTGYIATKEEILESIAEALRQGATV